MWTFDPRRRLYPSYPTAVFGGGLDRPPVEYGRRQARIPVGGHPDDGPEVVGHDLEAPGGEPPAGLLINGGPEREVVGQVPPVGFRLDQPANGVEQSLEVVPPLVAVLPQEGQVRGGERPLIIRHVRSGKPAAPRS
jgi:hypothetical protein